MAVPVVEIEYEGQVYSPFTGRPASIADEEPDETVLMGGAERDSRSDANRNSRRSACSPSTRPFVRRMKCDQAPSTRSSTSGWKIRKQAATPGSSVISSAPWSCSYRTSRTSEPAAGESPEGHLPDRPIHGAHQGIPPVRLLLQRGEVVTVRRPRFGDLVHDRRLTPRVLPQQFPLPCVPGNGTTWRQ